MYGYELRSEFEARTGSTWPLNVGQVYSTLSRLERDALVEAAGEDRKGHVYYRITSDGRQAVHDWFATPVSRTSPPRDELAIKLAMAVSVHGLDVREVVQARRSTTMKAVQEYTLLKSTNGQQQQRRRARIVPRPGLDDLPGRAEFRWLDHCEDQLAPAAGEYGSDLRSAEHRARRRGRSATMTGQGPSSSSEGAPSSRRADNRRGPAQDLTLRRPRDSLVAVIGRSAPAGRRFLQLTQRARRGDGGGVFVEGAALDARPATAGASSAPVGRLRLPGWQPDCGADGDRERGAPARAGRSRPAPRAHGGCRRARRARRRRAGRPVPGRRAAASSRGSRSPVRLSATGVSSSPTSPPARWTPRPANRCFASSARRWMPAPPASSSPTRPGWPRRPTASSFSVTGRRRRHPRPARSGACSTARPGDVASRTPDRAAGGARAKGRRTLIVAMVPLPVLGIGMADVLLRSAQLDADERVERQLGRARPGRLVRRRGGAAAAGPGHGGRYRGQ